MKKFKWIKKMGDNPTFMYNGTKYEITQDPYLTGEYGHYEASVKEVNGEREGSILWEIKSGVDIHTLQDESEACDWDNPTKIEVEGKWDDILDYCFRDSESRWNDRLQTTEYMGNGCSYYCFEKDGRFYYHDSEDTSEMSEDIDLEDIYINHEDYDVPWYHGRPLDDYIIANPVDEPEP